MQFISKISLAYLTFFLNFEEDEFPLNCTILYLETWARFFSKVTRVFTVAYSLKSEKKLPNCKAASLAVFTTMCPEEQQTRDNLIVKPGLHIVVTITEHASNVAPIRILKLSIYRLQIFVVKYEYLRSLQQCEDQGIREKFKNVLATMCLLSLRLIWRPGFKDICFIIEIFDKFSFSDILRDV